MTTGASFNGHSNLIDQLATASAQYSAPAQLAAAGVVSTTTHTYSSLNGMRTTLYGNTTETPVMGMVTTTKTTYQPGWDFNKFTLAPGAVDESSTDATTVGTAMGVQTSSVTSKVTQKTTYVGQEKVTVPAGSFTACKFTQPGPNGLITDWFGVGNGVLLKNTQNTSAGAGETVLELLPSSQLNGKAL